MSPLQQIDFRDIERVSVSKKSVYTHDEEVTNFMGSPFTLRIRTVEHSDNGGIYKLRTRYTLGEGLEIWGQSIVTYFPQTNRVETDLETRDGVSGSDEDQQLAAAVKAFATADTEKNADGLAYLRVWK